MAKKSISLKEVETKLRKGEEVYVRDKYSNYYVVAYDKKTKEFGIFEPEERDSFGYLAGDTKLGALIRESSITHVVEEYPIMQRYRR